MATTAIDQVIERQAAAAASTPAAGTGGTPPAALLARTEKMHEETNAKLADRLAKWRSLAVPFDAPEAVGSPISEAGVPITDYGYAYWDALQYGPYQFAGVSSLPVNPSKVVRAGEWVLLSALVWINPEFHLGNLPATQVIGGRQYNATFEMVNVSDVADGPSFVQSGTFAGPAPEYTWFDFWYSFPDPGPLPDIYEATFTIDIATSGLDLAAFATWHFDPDAELPFGPFAPRWRHDQPARFLVYRF